MTETMNRQTVAGSIALSRQEIEEIIPCLSLRQFLFIQAVINFLENLNAVVMLQSMDSHFRRLFMFIRSGQFSGLKKNGYSALLVDPPWTFNVWSKNTGSGRSASSHYQTESTLYLGMMPISDLAADDCALFMWACWPTLHDALKLIEMWGFVYKTCAFDWIKARTNQIEMFRDDGDAQVGMGYWTRANSEPCLLATRGKPKRLNADVRQGIIEPRRQHSRKPDCVHERIERLVARALPRTLRAPAPFWMGLLGQRGGQVHVKTYSWYSVRKWRQSLGLYKAAEMRYKRFAPPLGRLSRGGAIGRRDCVQPQNRPMDGKEYTPLHRPEQAPHRKSNRPRLECRHQAAPGSTPALLAQQGRHA